MSPFEERAVVDDAASTALGLKARPLASELIALEPRMVFDGAAAATVVAVIDAADHGAGAAPDAGGTDGAIDAAQRLAAAIEPVAPPAAPASREIVFIDSRVADQQAFVSAAGDNRLFVTINSNEDGLAVISRVLSEQTGDVSAVHIIGHGRDGEALLGSLLVDAGAVQDHSDMLQGWRSHLTADADILLYGCDIAAGDAGANLIAVLAEKTGADVAASKDSVGVSQAGADWSLETTTGQIEARVLAPANYAGGLAVSPEVTPDAWSITNVTRSYFAFVRGDTYQDRNTTLDTTPTFTGVASGSGTVRIYDRTSTGDVLVGSSATTLVSGTWAFSVTAGTYAAADGSAGRVTALAEGRHNLVFKQQVTGSTESTGSGVYSSTWVNVDLTPPPEAPRPVMLYDAQGAIRNLAYTPRMTTDDYYASVGFDLGTNWQSVYGASSRIEYYSKNAVTGAYTRVGTSSPTQSPSFRPFTLANLDLSQASLNATVTFYAFVLDTASNMSPSAMAVNGLATAGGTEITLTLVTSPKAVIDGFRIGTNDATFVSNASNNAVSPPTMLDSTPTLVLSGINSAASYFYTDTWKKLDGTTATLSGAVGGTVTGSTLSWTTDFLQSGGLAREGTHTLSVNGILNGVASVVSTMSFSIDGPPPEFVFSDNVGSVQLSSITGNSLVDAVSLRSTSKEIFGSVVTVSYKIDSDTAWRTGTATVSSTGDWTFVIPSNSLPPGVHTVIAKATDGSGKESAERVLSDIFVTGAWSPGGFGLANISAWYDATILSSLTYDASGNVSSWADLGGAGKTATQTILAAQPKLTISDNGNYTLGFTAASFLSIAGLASDGAIVFAGDPSLNTIGISPTGSSGLVPLSDKGGSRYGFYME
ncbi:MAG: uncharacterized protein JWN22_3939, partial [Nocardioides sp.]|nr:uncharacterized protein [Nocardioides sp.]